MKVQNKGNKGNPNHDDNTGKFTSENGTSSSNKDLNTSDIVSFINAIDTSSDSSKSEEDVGVFILDFDVNSIDSFLDSIDEMDLEERKVKAQEFIESIHSKYPSGVIEEASQLSIKEKKELLVNSSFEYDKNKLEKLSEDEIEALYLAETICFTPKRQEQKVLLAEKEKEILTSNIEKQQNEAIAVEFPNGYPSVSGIWFGTIDFNQYSTKKDIVDSNGKNAIDRKKDYYNDIINDPLSFESDIEEANKKLNELNQWILNCEKIISIKNNIESQYINDLEKAEQKIADELKKDKKYKDLDFLGTIKLSKDFIGNYQDKDAAYSEARKNNAIWIKIGTSFNLVQQSQKAFSAGASEMWNKMTFQERKTIKSYTGNGYSRFNKPLRRINHDPYGYSFESGIGGTFSKAVENLTNALDKCTWSQDIWVNRFLRDGTKMFITPGSQKARSLEEMSEEELQSLVGTSFKDGGFMSCGAAKGTGYQTGRIVLNIYCPSGTKMAYVAPYSSSGSIENEMIIQRGYSYRITKVEKKKGFHYLDLEVVLGSDEDKPVGNDLKALGNKYFYGPRGEKGEAYE